MTRPFKHRAFRGLSVSPTRSERITVTRSLSTYQHVFRVASKTTDAQSRLMPCPQDNWLKTPRACYFIGPIDVLSDSPEIQVRLLGRWNRQCFDGSKRQSRIPTVRTSFVIVAGIPCCPESRKPRWIGDNGAVVIWHVSPSFSFWVWAVSTSGGMRELRPRFAPTILSR